MNSFRAERQMEYMDYTNAIGNKILTRKIKLKRKKMIETKKKKNLEWDYLRLFPLFSLCVRPMENIEYCRKFSRMMRSSLHFAWCLAWFKRI